MKKTIAAVLAMIMLGSVALFAAGCQVAQVAPTQSGSDAQVESDAVVARIGDEVVTLKEYQMLFDSYSAMYSMYGMDVTADPSQLAALQENILQALLREAVIRHQTSQQGFDAFTAEQEAEVKTKIEETAADMRAHYEEMAKTELQNDPTLDVEQYVEDRLVEEAEYYTGQTSMDMEAYAAWMSEQVRESYAADLLKQSVTADVALSDGALQNWYDATLAAEKEQYTEDPGAYKTDEEAFEMSGEADGTMPVVYVPEGYFRIMDMQVSPKATASELYEDYDGKVEQLNTLSHEYGERAFANALENSTVNDARLAEILAEYKKIKAETDAMETEALKDAKAIIDEAYAKLAEGTTFESLQLRYTENPDFVASENFMMRGMLISTKHESATDWSDGIKSEFAKLAVGEYSPVFMDGGSYHIIYNAGEEPAGERTLEEVGQAAQTALLGEEKDVEWETLVETWMRDDAVKVFEEIYRSVGAKG